MVSGETSQHTGRCSRLARAASAADVHILAGNALYTALTDLCGIGQARYATTDARHYQDYVVTDTPAPPAPPQP